MSKKAIQSTRKLQILNNVRYIFQVDLGQEIKKEPSPTIQSIKVLRDSNTISTKIQIFFKKTNMKIKKRENV